MIGFYDYTVVLTFVSLMSTVIGMTQAMDGRFRIALICLAISGLCDTFDGKIARSKKNRTDDQKLYGIQLDSLCDVVCFGVFPAMICYLMGMNGVLSIAVLCYFVLCGVIRLAYFNVLETNRQTGDSDSEKVYHGLPITSISVILPLVFVLGIFVTDQVFLYMLFAAMLIVGTLYIVDFRLKKPKDWMIYTLIGIVACAVIAVALFSSHQTIHRERQSPPLIDRITESCDE